MFWLYSYSMLSFFLPCTMRLHLSDPWHHIFTEKKLRGPNRASTSFLLQFRSWNIASCSLKFPKTIHMLIHTVTFVTTFLSPLLITSNYISSSISAAYHCTSSSTIIIIIIIINNNNNKIVNHQHDPPINQ